MKWIFALALMSSAALAGEADVVGVEATRSGDTWRFSVAVDHADTGWEHYADMWRVVGPDGAVYGERVLAHPHVNERPFTRSLGGVSIPADVATVTIEARDSVHGWGGKTMTVDVN
ncbi:MAG: hypothetical protein ACPGFA_05845 [Pikeienuella sp.]